MKGKYEYDNDFWRECEREPFTPSEIALYMLLLHEANQNHWVMPFRCNTAYTCYRLTTTKQNIFKARQRLKERGLIDFTTGTGKNTPALYTLLDLSARLPVQLSDGLPVQPPYQLPGQLPVRLSIYKDKDRDKDNSILKARESEISLDELERKLLADTTWQDEVRKLLAKREISQGGNADLQERIRQFFQQQRVRGRTAREEADCRNHCFNWIASQLKNHRNGTDKHKRSTPAGLLLRRLQQPRTTWHRFRLLFTAEQAYTLLLAAMTGEISGRGMAMIIDDTVKAQVRQLASFLTTDTPHFGVLLCGGCGNGKTTLIRAFQHLLNNLSDGCFADNHQQGMMIVSARQLADLCLTNREAFLSTCRYPLLGIDDIGIEPKEVCSYGNIFTPVIDALTMRYEDRLFTFATTNLKPSQIRNTYGERIADRLNEMMEKIHFANNSFRSNGISPK